VNKHLMMAFAAKEMADAAWRMHQEMVEDGSTSELTSIEDAFKAGVTHACAGFAVQMEEVTKNKTLAQRN
jgi:hypothetical protein